MDLYAYAQIEDLADVASKNGIDIPRLRGYRWMANEKPVSKEEINDILTEAEIRIYRDGCESLPPFSDNPFGYELSERTRRLKKKYLIHDSDHRLIGFRWDRLHGKNRKKLKFLIKKSKKRYLENVMAWNRHAEDPSVLYIHARIGGRNWLPYGGDEISKQPWFIEKVDDPFDDTYCDIYAKIDAKESKNDQ